MWSKFLHREHVAMLSVPPAVTENTRNCCEATTLLTARRLLPPRRNKPNWDGRAETWREPCRPHSSSWTQRNLQLAVGPFVRNRVWCPPRPPRSESGRCSGTEPNMEGKDFRGEATVKGPPVCFVCRHQSAVYNLILHFAHCLQWNWVEVNKLPLSGSVCQRLAQSSFTKRWARSYFTELQDVYRVIKPHLHSNGPRKSLPLNSFVHWTFSTFTFIPEPKHSSAPNTQDCVPCGCKQHGRDKLLPPHLRRSFLFSLLNMFSLSCLGLQFWSKNTLK